MKKFEIFNNDKLGKVRTVIINNEIWFVLRDVCAIMGLSNMSVVKQRLQEDGVSSTYLIDSMGRKQNATIINEANLYLCILRSDKEEAKEFADWITKEVIPSIRKTGKYEIAKPKQQTYAVYPKEILKDHIPLKKYYNKVPVMGVVDLAYIIGCSLNTVHYHAGKNKTLIHKNEIADFKKENPMLPTTIAHMTILYREEVINICKKLKVYDKVKSRILAYFDDFVSETSKRLSESQEFTITQNIKADKLLQVLPHIAEEGLKSQIAIEVIRLIDNKILEEYENGRLNIKFIGNPEKRLEHKEDKSVKTITAKN